MKRSESSIMFSCYGVVEVTIPIWYPANISEHCSEITEQYSVVSSSGLYLSTGSLTSLLWLINA